MELDPTHVKSIYLAMVASMFDRGILPVGWARWTGETFELIDLPDIWDVVREELQGGARAAAVGSRVKPL